MVIHNRRRLAVPALALSSLALVAAASPAAADPLQQVEAREKLMKTMGGGMKTLTQFLKGEAGTAADARTAAAALVIVSGNDPLMIFPQGTAIGVGESEAKPELWSNWPKVTALWGELRTASAGLVQASASGDKAQIGPAVQAVGKVCQSCHEDFRLKKQ